MTRIVLALASSAAALLLAGCANGWCRVPANYRGPPFTGEQCNGYGQCIFPCPNP